MFDLFRSRETSVRILLGALMLLVGLSMLTYLVPDYSRGAGTANDIVVAEIGSETITLPEVQRSIQQAKKKNTMSAPVMPKRVTVKSDMAKVALPAMPR